MSAIYEMLAAGQPAFSTEAQEGAYVATPALGANEPTALEIRAKFKQYRANYSSPAVNSTITYNGQTAYFVADTDFQDERGGLQSWTRTWATLPANWTEPGGTFAFTFPAYVAGVAFGTLFPVSAVVANGNYYTANTNATGITSGESCLFDLNYVRNSQNFHVTFVTEAKFASSGVNVTIGKLLPGTSTFSGVTGTVKEWSRGRVTPETIEVDSFVLHEYALADETTVETLLPQVDRFSPVNASGYEVDILSTGLATWPNSADYASMIAAGTLIVARRSDRRKYAGNIWERTTLLVAAR